MSIKDNSGFKLMLAMALAILAIVLTIFIVKKFSKIEWSKKDKEAKIPKVDNLKEDKEVNTRGVKNSEEDQGVVDPTKSVKKKENPSEKLEKIKGEIDKLSDDSKNLIKDKLSTLKNRFDVAKKHLDEIKEKEGNQTISDDLKLLGANVPHDLVGSGLLCNCEELFRYEALLIAREINKIESANIEFKYENLDEQITNFEKRYEKFFNDINSLKNRNDFKSYWNYSDSYIFNNIVEECNDIGIDENFDLKKCQGIENLAHVYNEKTPNQNLENPTGLANPLFEDRENSVNGSSL